MKIIDSIKCKLVSQVVFGSKIKYQDFLNLYRPYSKLVPELIFATEVMNIKESNYYSLKHNDENLTIMPFFVLSKEEKEKIKAEMVKRFTNYSLNYSTFIGIYNDYSSMITEMDFAKEIFDINNSFYYKFRAGDYNALVFKSDENKFLNHYDIYYDYFYSLYKGQRIDYKTFKKLYDEYDLDLPEDDFAACLGISYNNYRSIKRNKRKSKKGDSYTLMFKVPKFDYSKINISELLGKYKNKTVNYLEFKKIYDQYGISIEENEFARIVGIRWGTFENYKAKKDINMIILKTELSEAEKMQVLENCRVRGLTRRLIDYNEFQKLYNPYKDYISESDFAYIIGIKQKSICEMKNSDKKSLALKFDLNNETMELMRREVTDLHNKYINYIEFQTLHSKYSAFISETEYTKMLGISLPEYYTIRNHPCEKTLIDFYKIERKIIKHQLTENKTYTVDDFNNICDSVGIDLEHLFILFFGESKESIKDKYLEALQLNGKLQIGDVPLSKNAPVEEILNFCKNYAKAVCINLYCPEIMEDIASEAVRYTLENCGCYEMNFGQNWQEIWKPYMVGIMKMWCRIYKSKQNISLDKNYDNAKGKTRHDFIASFDEESDFTCDVAGDNLYNQIILAIEKGMDMNNVIEKTAEKSNIKPAELLKLIKKHMIENQIIKQDIRGKVMLK
jgi:hypothetical protein